jgi:EAL domain-containing protein (putative c-di-GMP-specific phosphodiesterase class I)/GGDEF domain-containing protein
MPKDFATGSWCGWAGLPGEETSSVTSSRLPANAHVQSRLFPKTRSWFALGMPLELLSPLSVLRIIYAMGFLVWPVVSLASGASGYRLVVSVTVAAVTAATWIALLLIKEVGSRLSQLLAVFATVLLAALIYVQGDDTVALVMISFFATISAFEALCFAFRLVLPYQAITAGVVWIAIEHARGWATATGISSATLLALFTATMSIALTVRSARRHAAYDPETGLPNALGLAEILHDEQDDETLILACVLLEGISDAREAFGHRVGTELLRRSIEYLGQVAPTTALIGRVAGDELLVAHRVPTPVLDSTARSAAESHRAHDLAPDLASTLAQSISKGLFVVDGIELTIRPHIGLAVAHGNEVEIAHLVRHASLAAHRATELRQVQALWNGETTSMTAEDMALLADLRGAGSRGELSLAYQPQVAAATGRTISVEALLRWQSLQHGSVPPSHFIPLAERSGFIDRLTEWVLAEALDAQLRWRLMGLDLPVSVNLSAHSLTRPDLSTWVLNELELRDVPAAALQLEVTETAATADLLQAVDLLRPLHERGVRISLDDFGTGFTSLSVLPFLPLDELKVDQRFVRLAPISGPDEAIVRSVSELAHRLQLTAVAEGVENEEIRELMTSFGIDILQGYQISRPLAESALLAFVRDEEELLNSALTSTKMS